MKNLRLVIITISFAFNSMVNAQSMEQTSHGGSYYFDLEMDAELEDVNEVRHGDTGGF